MLLDFCGLDANAIEADLCIIGAGAAGIALACRFSGSGARVCLLESGGFEPDAGIQSLYEGNDAGFRPKPGNGPGDSRLQFPGGSTNHWVGHCAPYSDMDFEPRSWVPYSGWPIRRHDLDPYYRLAQEVMEPGPYQYDLTKSLQ